MNERETFEQIDTLCVQRLVHNVVVEHHPDIVGREYEEAQRIMSQLRIDYERMDSSASTLMFGVTNWYKDENQFVPTGTIYTLAMPVYRRIEQTTRLFADTPTVSLVNELAKREGVDHKFVSPYEEQHFRARGPARILVVTD